MREPYPIPPPSQGTPAAPFLIYTCSICGAEVRSIPADHERWACTCRNISIDPDAGRCSIKSPSHFSISRIIDIRNTFVTPPITLPSSIGPLLLGIIDPHAPGAAESVSWLLNRSITDALAERGGHLPPWLVADIRQNYISPFKIQTLWAKVGHRFALARADDGEMIGTVHIAKHHHLILAIDRNTVNVNASDYPGFKPEGAHHVVNLSVKHELRRTRLGRAMFDGILQHFRSAFDGDALWVRADPPWHAGLAGLGFSHDPSMDIFLPPEVERTSNLPHAQFNARYACTCSAAAPQKPEFLLQRPALMQTHKLQYVSFTRPLNEPIRSHSSPRPPSPLQAQAPVPADSPYSRDWGGILHRVPRGIVYPESPQELADFLRRASHHHIPVAVRGLGRSAAGQSLISDGLLISTERLNHIDLNTLGPDRITVQGGASWEQLLQHLLPQGLLPPVVTGFPSATVGGTLSSGGFSKGSIQKGFQIDHVINLLVATGDGRLVECSPTQARWLYDAVLGGMGHFGVIAMATLALERAPRGLLKAELDTGGDLGALLEELSAFAKRPDAYHATAFYKRGLDGEDYPMAVCTRTTEGEGDISLSDYLLPPRDTRPAGPTAWAHVFCSLDKAEAIILQARAMMRTGDMLQWLPIQKRRPERSLMRVADVPVGELFYAVMFNRRVREGDDIEEIEREHRAWIEEATKHGGKNALGGVLPRNREEWRAHLGEDVDEVLGWGRMADPEGILGFG